MLKNNLCYKLKHRQGIQVVRLTLLKLLYSTQLQQSVQMIFHHPIKFRLAPAVCQW
jgi:hypothetical protein